MVMFLAANTNNKANTAFSLFMGAIERFGLHERVREDQSAKNVGVEWLIFSNPSRRPGRGSSIAGKSCHN